MDCSGILLAGEQSFSPSQTFDCGQCFRFTPQPDGSYSGIAFGRRINVRRTEDGTLLSCGQEEFDSLWGDYFDLNRNYSALSELCAGDDFLLAARSFGSGIRLLRQEPWEALISFIVSQCNNIPRIRSIIERLCSLWGEPLADGFAFPRPGTLANLDEKELAPLRAGYRAEYIICAARAVASGALDLDALKRGSTEQARAELMQLRGVGRKVADCTLLFGLGRGDAFPIDVWMKRALSGVYPGGFDASRFGENAGIIQQYIFYYARENKLF